MSNPERQFHALTRAELTRECVAHGLSEHQARLVFQAIHRHGILDPAQMPGIGASCKTYLRTWPKPQELTLDCVHHAQDLTIKLRLRTPSGDAIESVVIPNGSRVTLCVSSQVGCAAACSFCHTGTMGLLRNLYAWEICEQYRLACKVVAQTQAQVANITNIVFMGMGEPLHNEAHVLQACRILSDDLGAGFSRRHIVMSTAGVGNRIRPFWENGLASVAVSLHATTDEVRSQLVPMNRQWNVDILRKILLDIPWRRKESVIVAYVLLDGVNDSHDDADRLANWIKGLPAKINLLEFNPFPNGKFSRASPEKLNAFRGWLDALGAFNTLRCSRGEDVMAACGQLAVNKIKSK